MSKKNVDLMYESDFEKKSNEVLEEHRQPKEVFEAQRMEIGGKIYRKITKSELEDWSGRLVEKTEWVLETPDMKPLTKEEVPTRNLSHNEMEDDKKKENF